MMSVKKERCMKLRLECINDDILRCSKDFCISNCFPSSFVLKKKEKKKRLSSSSLKANVYPLQYSFLK